MSTPEAAPSPGRGPIGRHEVEKKTGEFQQYAREAGALAQSYAQPEPQLLQQAFERGDIALGPAGAPGEIELVVTNYLKPNDSVRYTFNRAERAIQRIEVSSYLADPSDVVTMEVQFAKLPDGTNHVASMTVNGVSKQLVVQNRNFNYVRG